MGLTQGKQIIKFVGLALPCLLQSLNLLAHRGQRWVPHAAATPAAVAAAVGLRRQPRHNRRHVSAAAALRAERNLARDRAARVALRLRVARKRRVAGTKAAVHVQIRVVAALLLSLLLLLSRVRRVRLRLHLRPQAASDGLQPRPRVVDEALRRHHRTELGVQHRAVPHAALRLPHLGHDVHQIVRLARPAHSDADVAVLVAARVEQHEHPAVAAAVPQRLHARRRPRVLLHIAVAQQHGVVRQQQRQVPVQAQPSSLHQVHVAPRTQQPGSRSHRPHVPRGSHVRQVRRRTHTRLRHLQELGGVLCHQPPHLPHARVAAAQAAAAAAASAAAAAAAADPDAARGRKARQGCVTDECGGGGGGGGLLCEGGFTRVERRVQRGVHALQGVAEALVRVAVEEVDEDVGRRTHVEHDARAGRLAVGGSAAGGGGGAERDRARGAVAAAGAQGVRGGRGRGRGRAALGGGRRGLRAADARGAGGGGGRRDVRRGVVGGGRSGSGGARVGAGAGGAGAAAL
eukprot:Rhum_TRINITY_DN14641_c11_g1::Rhum_TRINITY_DN14641_c11_g1_i1::g.103185::m.103185